MPEPCLVVLPRWLPLFIQTLIQCCYYLYCCLRGGTTLTPIMPLWLCEVYTDGEAYQRCCRHRNGFCECDYWSTIQKDSAKASYRRRVFLPQAGRVLFQPSPTWDWCTRICLKTCFTAQRRHSVSLETNHIVLEDCLHDQMFHQYRKCDSVHYVTGQLSQCVCVCLKQVANLNPKDNTYSLRDFIYRDVQRDWPGYSEDEKSQVDRILARYRNGWLGFLLPLWT